MSNWKELAQTNASGALPYNIQGNATGLAEGHYLPTSQGGTGVDLSSANGLLYRDGSDTMQVREFPDEASESGEGYVLAINTSGQMTWTDFGSLDFSGLSTNDWVTNDQSEVEFGNLTVNGTLTINDGIIAWGTQDVTTTASMVKLNSDVTTEVTTGEFGFKVNSGDTSINDPQLYWSVDEEEWRIQTSLSTNEEKISLIHSVSGGAPSASLGSIGDLAIDDDTGKLYINCPS